MARLGASAPEPVALVAADPAEAIEQCHRLGWTDGLPVVPPTEDLVVRFLDEAHWSADDVLLHEPVRGVTVHAGAVVVNAVMAGCLPEHLPVIAAALRAMGHPDFRVHIPSSSTGGAAPVLVVNGPVRHAVDLNCAGNVFGPGHRANATIGRAVRLVLWNCLGARTGELDMATQGWFGKYTACFGEREEASPWPPLHVRLGFAAEASTVTVLATESGHNVHTANDADAEAILTCAVDVVRTLGSHSDGVSLLVVCPEHARVLARDGWTVRAVQERLFEGSRRTIADLRRGGRLEGPIVDGDEVRTRPRGRTPDDIVVAVAGGDAGYSSAWFPSWSRGRGSVAVTVPLDPRDGELVASVPGPADAPGLGDGR